ncbi:MAG: endonuclease/exonuclease/phosphatase family protein [Candidatus Nanoarchaeia archaeon]|nr:endonuclease/exonuclease/phosphatase family protein [Candidatus Nanoarchaeia archaeon]
MKLKLAHLNAWGMPWPLSVLRRTRMEIIACLIKEKDFDVVCLNEVWFKDDVEFLRKNLKGYNFVYMKEGKINEQGLVTISKYPLKLKEFIPFRRSEVFSHKGILISECDIKGFKVKVINTHLFHSRKLDKSIVVQGQLAKIKRILDKIPTILMGDFNIDADKVKFPGFNVISDTSIPTLNKENRYTHKLFNGLYSINLKCDIIFTNFKNKILRKGMIKEPLISDHYMIFSEIMV